MSSNGSGTNDPRILLAGTAPQPMSSQQRDAQRAAMAEAMHQHALAILALRQDSVAAEARIAALEGLTASLQQQADTLYNQHVDARVAAETRLDALERVTAARWSLPLWYRLRWLVLGR